MLRLSLGALALFLAGLSCAPRVLVPPRVQLEQYGTVGIATFSSNTEGDLARLSTQSFIEAIQTSQVGVPVLELGDSPIDIDPTWLKKMKNERGVDAIIVGNIDVSDVKPSLNISALLTSMSVKAEVEATLQVKLYSTEDGATIWTRSGSAAKKVGHVTVAKGRSPSFSASDPEGAYGELINSLVFFVTDDLRSHYVRQHK
jgi:hypothetical protein